MRTALVGVLLSVSAFALDTSKLKPTGYVNDFSHVLGASAAPIEAYCGAVERATGAQFAVVLVDSLEDEPIEEVANRLYREWGVGKKGNNEGLLLLLAIKDRKQRAEVGYGLEGSIPDGFAGSVLRGIRPILRQGNYSGALLAAVQQYGAKVAQDKGVTIEGSPPVRERPAGRGGSLPIPAIIIGLLAVWVLSRVFGGGGRGGGGIGSFLSGMLLGNLMGGRRGGWGGGGFGGYDSGGGGGGGFGGFGGGDSGGGGASSDW
jgi:uncharacterized protein